MAIAHAVDNDVIVPSRRGLLGDAAAALRAHVRHGSPEVRWLARWGWVFVLSGLAHVLVWLVDGRPPLEGPTGWRKPIVFGLSGGVTTLSLAALRVGVTPKPKWTLVYLVTMGLELALIDLQAWRGVASHFNVSTAFDGAVFSLMGALILGSMTAAVVLGLAAAKDTRDADRALSTRLATGALALGSVIGIAMSVHGSIVQQLGGTPSRIGAGDWRPVHAIALHGLQLFPIAAWWLRRRAATTGQRVTALWRLALAWGLLATGAFVQLLLRRAPNDPTLPMLLLAGAAIALGLATAVQVLRWPATRAAQ